MRTLLSLLRRTYRLLRRTAPIAGAYDVAWQGPFFIPRSGTWHPTHFLLYDGQLFCTVTLGWDCHQLTWRVGTDEVHFEHESSWTSYEDDDLWRRVLEQAVPRLREAVERPDLYNGRVERLLPLECRTGKIERRLTWKPGARPPISAARVATLERFLAKAAERPGLHALTLSRYLKTAAIALDAAFKDLKHLSSREKYRKRADTRHGGLLDLPANDALAFARWHRSSAWHGCHPWEIVFAHPHGILLAPLDEEGAWRYSLSVDSLGLYAEAARMASTLLELGVPLRFENAPQVFAALRGTDLVEVGPFFRQLHLEELEQYRPRARTLVHWDPIAPITAATDDDRKRIARAEVAVGYHRDRHGQ